MDITARIEKNRMALLAIIAPWFAFVLFYWGRGAKPLPPRISAFTLDTLAKMQKAAGYLLIASVYSALCTPKRTAEFENMAFCLARTCVQNAHSRVTIRSLHGRLFTIWRFVNQLYRIARVLARRMKAQQFLRALCLMSGPIMRHHFAQAPLATALPVHRETTGPP